MSLEKKTFQRGSKKRMNGPVPTRSGNKIVFRQQQEKKKEGKTIFKPTSQVRQKLVKL